MTEITLYVLLVFLASVTNAFAQRVQTLDLSHSSMMEERKEYLDDVRAIFGEFSDLYILTIPCYSTVAGHGSYLKKEATCSSIQRACLTSQRPSMWHHLKLRKDLQTSHYSRTMSPFPSCLRHITSHITDLSDLYWRARVKICSLGILLQVSSRKMLATPLPASLVALPPSVRG